MNDDALSEKEEGFVIYTASSLLVAWCRHVDVDVDDMRCACV